MIELKEQLKNFRKAEGLTQKKFADELGISQVHISRIENGSAGLSKSLETKILSIIGRTGQGINAGLRLDTDKNWSIASFVLADDRSGDRILVNKKNLESRTILLHCDSPGHGLNAKYMSDYLTVGFESVLSTILSDLICTPEFIYNNLDRMVKNTRHLWAGGPSCNILVFNQESRKIQILNAGMPNMWLTKGGAKDIVEVEDKKWPPLGGARRKGWPFSKEIILERGDALFSFSDGLIEAFKAHSTLPLRRHISSISRSLKGDAESIGTKLLVILNDKIKTSKTSDDISFLVVSKK